MYCDPSFSKTPNELIRTKLLSSTSIFFNLQAMEQQIKAKENQSEGASNAVKNLEMHHVAGLTDLRGRVARYSFQLIVHLYSGMTGCKVNALVKIQQQSGGKCHWKGQLRMQIGILISSVRSNLT